MTLYPSQFFFFFLFAYFAVESKNLLLLTLQIANFFRVAATNSSSLKKSVCRNSYSLTRRLIANSKTHYHVIKKKSASDRRMATSCFSFQIIQLLNSGCLFGLQVVVFQKFYWLLLIFDSFKS